jgi:hypothetical protein
LKEAVIDAGHLAATMFKKHTQELTDNAIKLKVNKVTNAFNAEF